MSKPKLRLLDVRPVVHQGQPSLLLRDSLQLSDRTLVVARSLAPVLAGQSYPANADELRRALDDYLAGAEVEPDSADGCGLVSPHIDYLRGSPVYARVWKRAAPMIRAAELAVVIGTDHFGGRGLNLTRQNYATPFGVLPTERRVVDALAEIVGEAAFEGELRHRGEHSIELAAVWLHHIGGGRPCALAPILCGSAEFQRPMLNAALAALREAAAGRRTIIVAAGDLSHGGPAFGGDPLDAFGRARLMADDDELIRRMCQGDAEGFYRAVQRDGDKNNVCGLGPIYLALRMMDGAKGEPVAYDLTRGVGAHMLEPPDGAKGEPVAYDLCPADEEGTSVVRVCGVVFKSPPTA